MIPALDALFAAASRIKSISHHYLPIPFVHHNTTGGVQHIILGKSCLSFHLLVQTFLSTHRSRLNLLTDRLQYSPTALFHKIKGGYEIHEELGAEGNVLSHLGSFHFFFIVGVDSSFLFLVFTGTPKSSIPRHLHSHPQSFPPPQPFSSRPASLLQLQTSIFY
jgi:hypothetical protein